jgi:predicted esterase
MKSIFSLLLLVSTHVYSQTERFTKDYFREISQSENFTYGSSITQNGVTMELKMDIYQPVDDLLEARPLVILAHGGYFFFGDKDEFTEECTQLAHAGYVAVSINYRLIDVEDDSFRVAQKAVIDAVADLKAAVRFFYKDAQTANNWRIDTNNIFIGGYSAGAIASLHYAYVNNPEDLLLIGGQELLDYTNSKGGLEGTSGNADYSTNIRGVINISGALLDASLVDKTEPILFSVHGTEDIVVPYESGLVGTTRITTEGSAIIHKRAKKIGLTNYLKVMEGSDHYGFLDCVPCLDEMFLFLKNNLQLE